MSAPVVPAEIGVAVDCLAPLRDPAADRGAVLERIPACAADLRDELRRSGEPDRVDTCDLVTLPYPVDHQPHAGGPLGRP